MLDKYQQKGKELIDKLKHANYHTKYFSVGGKVTQLICRSDIFFCANNDPKLCINLLPYVKETDHTEITASQHYY